MPYIRDKKLVEIFETIGADNGMKQVKNRFEKFFAKQFDF